jgi:hypothetical protein
MAKNPCLCVCVYTRPQIILVTILLEFLLLLQSYRSLQCPINMGRYICWWTISPRGYHRMSDDILIKIERGIYLGIINLTKTLWLEKIKNQSKYLIRYILRKI